MSMRFGMSMTLEIFEKLLRTRKLLWIVGVAIQSPIKAQPRMAVAFAGRAGLEKAPSAATGSQAAARTPKNQKKRKTPAVSEYTNKNVFCCGREFPSLCEVSSSLLFRRKNPPTEKLGGFIAENLSEGVRAIISALRAIPEKQNRKQTRRCRRPQQAPPALPFSYRDNYQIT